VEEVAHRIQSMFPVYALRNTSSRWFAFSCGSTGFHSAHYHHRSGFLSSPV